MREAALLDLVGQLAAAYVLDLRKCEHAPEDENGSARRESQAARPDKSGESEVS